MGIFGSARCHLESVGESYWTHQRFATRIGGRWCVPTILQQTEINQRYLGPEAFFVRQLMELLGNDMHPQTAEFAIKTNALCNF
jgi:hypothetical protein